MSDEPSLFAVVGAALAMSACSDFDNGFDARQEKYLNEFEAAFGTMDPNHDWSMAQKNTANFNLGNIKGDAVVTLFNGNPAMSKNAKILGKSVIKNGQGSFNFYSVKGINDVYVQVQQGKKTALLNKYAIEDNGLYVGEFATRAFSSACPTVKDGETYEIGVTYMPLSEGQDATPQQKVTYYVVNDNENDAKTLEEWIEAVKEMWAKNSPNNHAQFWYASHPFVVTSIATPHSTDPNNYWQGFVNEELDFTHYEINTSNTKTIERTVGGDDSTPTAAHVKVQYLKNVERQAAEPWTCGDGYSLYGVDAFFQEYKHYYKSPKLDTYGTTAEEKKAVVEKIEADFDIITKKTGLVSVPFIYGATSNNNQLGYVICDPDEDPLTKTHYVLMNDGRPQSNIYRDSWKGGSEETMTSGFIGTSIYDSFIYALRNGEYSVYDHRYDAIPCHCTPGTGIWSEAYGTGESDGEDREGNGIYSSALQHNGCVDPMQTYLDAYNAQVYGTEYLLSYWDSSLNNGDGGFTYDIPAGKKIVFFVLTHTNANTKVAADYDDNDFTYSLPSLNKRVNRLYYNYESPTFETGNDVVGDPKARGAVKSVAWKVGDVIYMGFEDGGRDEDLNDIVFVVDGDIKTNELVRFYPIKWHYNNNKSHDVSDTDLYQRETVKDGEALTQPSNPVRDGYEFLGWATTPTGTPIPGSAEGLVLSGTVPTKETCYFAIWQPIAPESDPEPVSWIFACEDLGGSYDYDFNDIVWEISQTTSGEGENLTYNDIEVKVLASGGVLPVKILYNESPIGGEIHEAAFDGVKNGAGRYSQVNVKEGEAVKPGKVVGTIPANNQPMDIDAIKSKIKIFVTDSDKEAIFITAPKKGDNEKAPQILILPGTWQWPTEGTSIEEAYPKFAKWVLDSKYTDWNDAVSGKVVTR